MNPMDGWMPPRDDINAPDLYIPSECSRFVLVDNPPK